MRESSLRFPVDDHKRWTDYNIAHEASIENVLIINPSVPWDFINIKYFDAKSLPVTAHSGLLRKQQGKIFTPLLFTGRLFHKKKGRETDRKDQKVPT